MITSKLINKINELSKSSKPRIWERLSIILFLYLIGFVAGAGIAGAGIAGAGIAIVAIVAGVIVVAGAVTGAGVIVVAGAGVVAVENNLMSLYVPILSPIEWICITIITYILYVIIVIEIIFWCDKSDKLKKGQNPETRAWLKKSEAFIDILLFALLLEGIYLVLQLGSKYFGNIILTIGWLGIIAVGLVLVIIRLIGKLNARKYKK